MTVLLALALVLAACGGGDSGEDDTDTGTESNESGDSGSGSGDVVDQQPAGQAYASVDGQEFTFDTPGPSDCIIEPEILTFSFVIGDNSVTLAGGANLYEDGWLGNVNLRLINDEGLPVSYYPDDGAMDAGVAIDGDSMSFSGPMLMQPPNDGSNPPPVSAGDGTISVTCG
jgi:hypothetical protein